MANYSLVSDASFKPFSMQEMLVPFSAYKDAFEKSEEQYDQLSQGADKFKYLSETLPEGSKARQVYEGYANDLRTQAEDLAHNGLTMGNRRALTSLKRRYQGEIGRLLQADEAMREEKKLRRSINAQDPSRLYAEYNLNIDNFLDGNTPNLYSISGNELYAKGAEAGKAASARIYNVGDGGSTLGGMFRDFIQRVGYSPETIAAFRQNAASLPELNEMADDIMNATGAAQNLTGVARGQARQQILNGMINGAIYQENHNPIRDPNVLSAAERAQIDMQQKNFNLNKSQLERQYMAMGYRLDKNGVPYKDEQLIKDLATLKQAGKGKSGSSDDSLDDGYTTKNSKGIKISWHGNNPNDTNGDADNDISIKQMGDDDALPGTPVRFNALPTYVQNKVKNVIGGGKTKLYRYYYQPFVAGGGPFNILNDTEAEIAIVPADVVKFNKNPSLDFGMADTNKQSSN